MTFDSFPRPIRPCRDDKEARVAASSLQPFVHASTLLSDGSRLALCCTALLQQQKIWLFRLGDT